MDGYLKRQAAQFALEQLMKTPAGEKLQQALQLIQTMQEHLAALSAKEEALSVTGAKAATVLTLAVLKKIADEKTPSSFNKEDWEELGHAVISTITMVIGIGPNPVSLQASMMMSMAPIDISPFAKISPETIRVTIVAN